MDAERTSLYADPEVYDILHWPGTPREVADLVALSQRFVPAPPGGRRARWLEPACGSGRYLRVAMALGIDVFGFDLSREMIAHARAMLPSRPAAGRALGRARMFAADMTDFDRQLRPGSIDFAFNPINSIRHLGSDNAVLAHFAAIARVLRPGGVYAVGLSLSRYGGEFPSEDVWQGRRGGVHVRQVIEYLPPRTRAERAARAEVAHSHLIIARKGRAVEHRDSSYVLRTYGVGQWRSLIARSALETAGVTDERGVPLHFSSPGYCVWVLRGRG